GELSGRMVVESDSKASQGRLITTERIAPHPFDQGLRVSQASVCNAQYRDANGLEFFRIYEIRRHPADFCPRMYTILVDAVLMHEQNPDIEKRGNDFRVIQIPDIIRLLPGNTSLDQVFSGNAYGSGLPEDLFEPP